MTTYLSLGSNIPDRAANLHRAVEQIAVSVGTVTMQSPIYETQSWGYTDGDYLNQTIAVETALPPQQLLTATAAIETALGRVRSGNGYEARTIDIDILFYDNEKPAGLKVSYSYKNKEYTCLELFSSIPFGQVKL